MDLKFNEETHEYTYNGKKIPSVTTIMKFITDIKYSGVTESILDVAKEKGTEVHQAIEIYNKTGYAGISSEYGGYLNAYLKWLSDYNIDRKLMQSETKTFHEVLQYAGTVDLIYNKDTVIDIKTCAECDAKTTAVQVSAYREALKRQNYNIKNQYILWLSKDGNYKYIKLDDKFNIFLACLQLYNFIDKK